MIKISISVDQVDEMTRVNLIDTYQNKLIDLFEGVYSLDTIKDEVELLTHLKSVIEYFSTQAEFEALLEWEDVEGFMVHKGVVCKYD